VKVLLKNLIHLSQFNIFFIHKYKFLIYRSINKRLVDEHDLHQGANVSQKILVGLKCESISGGRVQMSTSFRSYFKFFQILASRT